MKASGEKMIRRGNLYFLLLLTSFACNIEAQNDKEWWKHATFYHVYPRSLMDSNGDGIGDLKGEKFSINFLYEIT